MLSPSLGQSKSLSPSCLLRTGALLKVGFEAARSGKWMSLLGREPTFAARWLTVRKRREAAGRRSWRS